MTEVFHDTLFNKKDLNANIVGNNVLNTVKIMLANVMGKPVEEVLISDIISSFEAGGFYEWENANKIRDALASEYNIAHI